MVYIFTTFNTYKNNTSNIDFAKFSLYIPFIILSISIVFWIVLIFFVVCYIFKMNHPIKISLDDFRAYNLEATPSLEYKKAYMYQFNKTGRNEVYLDQYLRDDLAFKTKQSDQYYERLILSTMIFASQKLTLGADFINTSEFTSKELTLYLLKYVFYNYQKQFNLNIFKFEQAVKKLYF
ncbi:hypothetical protein [Mycoplasma hafezii]|uniref:hypothetical protein n=1 Tax=Mycoplasma hafezii TaxID=525886 RepID=UPI003CF3CFB9